MSGPRPDGSPADNSPAGGPPGDGSLAGDSLVGGQRTSGPRQSSSGMVSSPGAAAGAPVPPALGELARALAGRSADDLLPEPWRARGAGSPSAVLLLLSDGPDPGLVYTERASGLRDHGGQVSFPGGRVECGDAGAAATALREAHEEIGLDAGAVHLMGTMPAVNLSVTGFDVVPVVGWWHPDVELAPSTCTRWPASTSGRSAPSPTRRPGSALICRGGPAGRPGVSGSCSCGASPHSSPTCCCAPAAGNSRGTPAASSRCPSVSGPTTGAAPEAHPGPMANPAPTEGFPAGALIPNESPGGRTPAS